MIVVRDYRGHRIEINAVDGDGRWNHERLWRGEQSDPDLELRIYTGLEQP